MKRKKLFTETQVTILNTIELIKASTELVKAKTELERMKKSGFGSGGFGGVPGAINRGYTSTSGKFFNEILSEFIQPDPEILLCREIIAKIRNERMSEIIQKTKQEMDKKDFEEKESNLANSNIKPKEKKPQMNLVTELRVGKIYLAVDKENPSNQWIGRKVISNRLPSITLSWGDSEVSFHPGAYHFFEYTEN